MIFSYRRYYSWCMDCRAVIEHCVHVNGETYQVFLPRRITKTDTRAPRQSIGFVTKRKFNWVFGTTLTNNKGYAKTRRNAARQLASLAGL